MNQNLIQSADVIGRFCRLQLNTKRDLPIRASEMGVMIYAQRQSEPVTPLMISQFFNITKPSVSSMVNTLLKRNYLMKVRNNADHRSYLLQLTESGNELVASTFSSYIQSVEKIYAAMGDTKFHEFISLLTIANHVMEGDPR